MADRLLYVGVPQPSIGHLVIQYSKDVYVLGPLGIVALAGVLTWTLLQSHTLQGKRLATLIVGLLSSWFLWAIFMRNHMYIHQQEVLYAVPGTAAAIGIALAFLLEWGQTLDAASFKLMRLLLLGIVPSLLVMGMIREILTLPPFSDGPRFYMHFGITLGQNTPRGSVVLIPNDSRIPIYYSGRHVIRGVQNDLILASIRSRVRTVFPSVPLYLALQTEDMHNFREALQHDRIVVENANLVLIRLDSNRQ